MQAVPFPVTCKQYWQPRESTHKHSHMYLMPQASQNSRLGLPVLIPHHHTLSAVLVYPVPDLSCELVCHPQRGLGQPSQLMVQEHTARASERKARCHTTSATTLCSQLGHRLSRKVQNTTPPCLGFLFITGTKNVLFRLNDI